MKTKTLKNLLIVILMIFSLTACEDDKLAEEITVGVVLPLSGSLGSLGTALENAANLALEEVNSNQGNKIRFIIEDSGSSPEGAVVAYNKLIQEDAVTAILGPVTSSETKEAFPIAQENKVVGFSPLAAAQGLSEMGDFVFQANLTVDVVIPGGVQITADKFGYQKVAVLVDSTDLFSQSAFEVLQTTFTDLGIELLTTETLETGDTDLSAQLERIKDVEPDAIFISTLPIEAVEILTQADTLDMPDDVTFLVPFAFSTGEVEGAGDAAEGVVTFSTWVSSAETPGNQAFVQNYTANYGDEPSRFLAQEYASVHILAAALRNAPSSNSEDIRDALANIKDFNTVLGKFSFDATGRAIYDPIILIVKNGALEVLE